MRGDCFCYFVEMFAYNFFLLWLPLMLMTSGKVKSQAGKCVDGVLIRRCLYENFDT